MAYACQFTDPQSGVIVQSNDSDFMALWIKIGREQQAKEDRVRAILTQAGARYSQIHDGWFRQKGDWETATPPVAPQTVPRLNRRSLPRCSR